jgi:hypothetical protein
LFPKPALALVPVAVKQRPPHPDFGKAPLALGLWEKDSERGLMPPSWLLKSQLQKVFPSCLSH